jgi:hypothetical protein
MECAVMGGGSADEDGLYELFCNLGLAGLVKVRKLMCICQYIYFRH